MALAIKDSTQCGFVLLLPCLHCVADREAFTIDHLGLCLCNANSLLEASFASIR